MTPAERLQRLEEYNEVRSDPAKWFRACGWWRDEETRLFRRGKENVLQRRMFAHYEACQAAKVPCRIVACKYRRAGSSTASSALIHLYAMDREARLGVIGTDYKASTNMLDMVRDFAQKDTFPGWKTGAKVGGERKVTAAEWEEGGSADHIKHTIATRIDYGHGSRVELYTAKNPESARSSGLNGYLATEVARWQMGGEQDAAETLTAMRNALPKRGFHVVIEESTANGAQGAFYETCRHARWPANAAWARQWSSLWPLETVEFGAETQFVFIFAAWFEDSRHVAAVTPEKIERIRTTLDPDEQTLIERYQQEGPRGPRLGAEVNATVWEQLAWRRGMIATVCTRAGADEFKQEYPCVAGGVRVGTSRGIIPIREMMQGSQSDHGQVLKHVAKGIKPVLDVTTKRGFRLRVTADHRLALAAGGFTEASESLGKAIALQPPMFANDHFTLAWEGFGGALCCLPIDRSWARLIGYFMGNGSLHNAMLSVVFNECDADVVEDCRKLITSLFGEPQSRRPSRSRATELRLSRKDFTPLFERLGIIKQGERKRSGEIPWKRKVCVPECLWRSPKDIVRQFLSGLFEADGWASDCTRSVRLFSKYENFMRDVQLLLLGFEIHAGIRYAPKKRAEGDLPGWELSLPATEAPKFFERIGFVSARKTARGQMQPKGKVGRPPMNIEGHDEVVSITPAGEEEVFDLTIAGEPVFGANGVLVHNCDPREAFRASGSPALDQEGLLALEAMCRGVEPEWLQISPVNSQKDAPMSVTRMQEAQATLAVWEEPFEGGRYLVSCDPMSGAEQVTGTGEKDRHAVFVLRDAYTNQRGEYLRVKVVARIKAPCQWESEVLAQQLWWLSRWYGSATIVVESNIGAPILKWLLEVGANLYQRQELDTITQKVTKHLGWQTSEPSRRVLIATLQHYVREQALELCCPHAVSEMGTLVINRKGKAEASGSHKDDDCLGLAIALTCLGSAHQMPMRKAVHRLPPDLRRWRTTARASGLFAL